jgi:hypothetical protein
MYLVLSLENVHAKFDSPSEMVALCGCLVRFAKKPALFIAFASQ